MIRLSYSDNYYTSEFQIYIRENKITLEWGNLRSDKRSK
jgi:hypothetical protein